MLRYLEVVDPPKVHDVGPTLDRLITISRDLREEREKAFYGEVDFIPTEEYGMEDGERARDGRMQRRHARRDLWRARHRTTA